MDDLVKRMGRQLHSWELDEPFDDWWTYQKDFRNARDLIETQAADIARLREALGKIAPMIDWMMHPHCVKAETIIRQALGDSQ